MELTPDIEMPMLIVMATYPGADPEYSAFYSGLGKFDKEEFRRFRRRHPALTNEEAMRLFKMNHGHSQILGHHL